MARGVARSSSGRSEAAIFAVFTLPLHSSCALRTLHAPFGRSGLVMQSLYETISRMHRGEIPAPASVLA
jgi:hypothetical protein